VTNIIKDSDVVIAVTQFNDHLFVARPKQVAVYNATTFQPISDISFSGSDPGLQGLAVDPINNLLYVSEAYEVVHIVNLTTLTVTNISVLVPVGMSINRANNVLVACDTGQLWEYTSNGTLVRQLSTNTQQWHAVEVKKGTIAITHRCASEVILMSTNGSVLARYGSVSGPRYLAVDKKGFMLVADFENHRIIALDPTLTTVRNVTFSLNPAQPLRYPQGLWLDESRGRLYVGEGTAPSRLLIIDNFMNVNELFT
jgi:hypothetical protein